MGWRDEQAFFDQLADTWDARTDQETLARLAEIITRLRIRPGSRVLDVGCGTGVLFTLIRSNIGASGQLIRLDVSRQMLSHAVSRSGADLCIQADARLPPIHDHVFDWIICNAVLPHFKLACYALCDAVWRRMEPWSSVMPAVVRRSIRYISRRAAQWLMIACQI
ncbi:MAG: methyltransferase domain-containing protein [Roseiflexus sp.]|jgi:ubiquinone/menaquinone biosynthesis C-methylase UbiE|nr:methyltransferase domain-containing protein [Roseiflexus sp.]MBO9333986.1 methyltransferase domain-containing protein [Roseiflexus sp.]MBO9342759.1 methyltransferase domain-containing protein [Roseiflexus sp.]MBO9364948.1 methyltransferase domain-containing protein [Roseiflexus sp.]MBO9382697.1 methyltransferase domain-containing protein [Roseiflexus sp.]